jgi:DnaJ family protein A protein 2
VFEKQSDEYPGRPTGDIIITLKERKAPCEFQRKQNDLYYRKQISLRDALCGYNFIIHHLDGRNIRCKSSSSIIKPGNRKKIEGEGMRIRQNGKDTGKNGNLYIIFDVVFPDKLGKTAVNQLKKALPTIITTNSNVDHVDIEYAPTNE